MKTPRRAHTFVFCSALSGAIACGSSEDNRRGATGEDCQPQQSDTCQEDLSCEPLASGTGNVCGAPLTLRGAVHDALAQEALGGARVIALNAEGAPVSDVAISGADGRYELRVMAARNRDGSVAADASWTLSASAQGYQPFPAGPRPAVPISGQQAGGEQPLIEAANTAVSLLPLANAADLPHTIAGTLAGEEAGGALVIAEGAPAPAPYTIVARDGTFVLFNVPAASLEVAAYKRSQQFERATADTRVGSVSSVYLGLSAEGLGAVAGNVNIVNAPGGSLTSVVLVPESVFDPALQRGPVPFGLRAPEPPALPSVNGAFAVDGIPRGRYVVLAAFENDLLVRDPDTSIGGTNLQRVTVADGEAVTMAESFKITEHLAIVGPGADGPEAVSAAPVFRWADDSSEDRYELELYSALGDLVWADRAVPSVSGSETVSHTYDGPALLPGMIYQFRVTSFRDHRGSPAAISRSEDLRGVFSYE